MFTSQLPPTWLPWQHPTVGLAGAHTRCAAQIYTAQMVLDCVRAYNATAELLPLLPASVALAADGDAAVALRTDELPPMLTCDWRGDLPTVRRVPFDAGAMPASSVQHLAP